MDPSLKNSSGLKRNFLQRGVHFLYDGLIEPRSAGEDLRRRELILNVILCGSIALLVFLEFLLIWHKLTMGPRYGGLSYVAFSILPIAFMLALLISRRGRFFYSSYFLITFFYAATTYGIFRWGTDLPITLLMYALLIVMAGVLVGTRFSMMFTAVVVVSIISCRVLQDSRLIDVDLSWRLLPSIMTDAVKYAFFLCIVEIVTWLWNKDTEKALERAVRSEKALIEQNAALEATVAERTRELKQAQADKLSQLYRFAEFGRLSSGIFHDLMNPLSAVASNVRELDDSIHPDMRDVKDYVGRAVVASRKLERFVGTVRKQISMAEHEEEFCLNDEIEEALALLEYKATKEKVDLVWRADQRVRTYGNPAKFHHVASNLISNAIDAYSGFRTDDRTVSVRLSEKNGDIRLAVTDRGCGIAEGLIDKIFDPFFTTKDEQKGMGLGLSNTKQIVIKNFKGTIRVRSEKGKGSTFTVSFPRAYAPRHAHDSSNESRNHIKPARNGP